MDLRGSVAMITGGAGGIGRAIVEGYSRAGSRVAMIDILPEKVAEAAMSIEAGGGQVMPVVADISDPVQVHQIVARIERELGQIDILVNCAGILKTIGPVWEVDEQTWLKEITVNLYGAFLCSRTVASGMVGRGRGYILCMVGGGVSDPHPYSVGYACSKVGVMRLVEGLAAELKPRGIKIFAMQPALTRTGMTEFILDSSEGQKWRPDFHTLFDEQHDQPPEQLAQLAINLVGGRVDELTGRYFNAQWDFDEVVRCADQILGQDLLTLRIRDMPTFPTY